MWQIILSFLASVAAAFAGALGLGGGGPLILYLTIALEMEQRRAQGINLVFFIPTAVISLLLHRKNGLIEGNISRLSLPFGLIGILGGIWLSRRMPSELLGKIFAGLLILLALKDLWGLARDFFKKRRKKQG